eukprot:UN18543
MKELRIEEKFYNRYQKRVYQIKERTYIQNHVLERKLKQKRFCASENLYVRIVMKLLLRNLRRK